MKSISAKELKNRTDDVLRRVGRVKKCLSPKGESLVRFSLLWKGIDLSGHNSAPIFKHGKTSRKPCAPPNLAIKLGRKHFSGRDAGVNGNRYLRLCH
jgi:hypothetical protein